MGLWGFQKAKNLGVGPTNESAMVSGILVTYTDDSVYDCEISKLKDQNKLCYSELRSNFIDDLKRQADKLSKKLKKQGLMFWFAPWRGV